MLLLIILILLVALGVAGALAVRHICHRFDVLAGEIEKFAVERDLASLAQMAGMTVGELFRR
jgi:hypothetical protein